MTRRHWIIANRAICGRCRQELESLPRAEYQLCRCGYLAIDGGRTRCMRTCRDRAEDREFRDFVDTSVVTVTYERRGGLIVEAFRAEGAITVVGPDGRAGQAVEGDYCVFEPEGGHTAWAPGLFHERHTSDDASNWS